MLLIEAGGENSNVGLRTPYDRYSVPFAHSEMDHGLVTIPQSSFNEREIPYLRGKGLGGSSAINFMAYNYGADADFDRWATLVGDTTWEWENVKARLNAVSHFVVCRL